LDVFIVKYLYREVKVAIVPANTETAFKVLFTGDLAFTVNGKAGRICSSDLKPDVAVDMKIVGTVLVGETCVADAAVPGVAVS